MTNHYFAFDVETTGLNYDPSGKIIANNLLSISYILLDHELNELISGSYVVRSDFNTLFEMTPSVFDMHCSTGLIQDIQAGKCLDITEVTSRILSSILPFLEDGEKIQPIGNNVQFDVEVIRRIIPGLFKLFHYSFLDVSSIRNGLGLHDENIPQLVYEFKNSNHDSMVDIRECIKELKLYLNLFNGIKISDVKKEIKLMEESNV